MSTRKCTFYCKLFVSMATAINRLHIGFCLSESAKISGTINCEQVSSVN